MHKFIEIPIYALDKSTLRVRYEKYVDTLRREVFPDIIEETFQRCLEIETYPKRVWEYNHIVGYVVIGYEFGDISFKLYLPTPQKRICGELLKRPFCMMYIRTAHISG